MFSRLRQFWSDSGKNKRLLQLDQNTGDEGGLLSSKVWKIVINGSGFGEGIKSIGNLHISLAVCFE